MKQWIDTLDARSRIGLALGAATIVLAMALAGWWLLRAEQAVLFSELKPQDAAVVAAELDKLKIAYTVADGGAALLVDAAQVHATRLKLMGRDLPLHGAVGLELFNTTDFGMTEFAQKINYQRALQGELTRTILSFNEVQDARVHLALPEQGLFRQPATRPKAAITLTLRHGQALRAEQVSGIQRLVAAAVPGLVAQEVTVVDPHGVALSRVSGDAEGDAGGRLDLKRDTENYLSRKAGAVLERAFGPGQALASVDVTLNMDQVRTTTEDVLAAPDASGGLATGVLVRERESSRDAPASAPGVAPAQGADARATRGASVQRDAEYQTGRRVEQVVSQPGSIRRLQVVAVVRQPLAVDQQEQVRRLIAAAVGAVVERGDTVLVQSFAPVAAPAPEADGAVAASPQARPAVGAFTDMGAAGQRSSAPAALAWLLLAVVVAGAAWVLYARSARPGRSEALSAAQRDAALRRV
ncbi:MAG TPA: flagellar basal-body MS-ring/collar protein FliF, partial [Ramlibacter sp.]|nr:flagellar basal-body MS-ring/collar protein FliF [Ramlibacter sp.]